MIKNTSTPILTSFKDLDSIISGLKAGEITLVAGRVAMGKTSFLLNIVCNVALIKQLPIAFFSTRVKCKDLVSRIIKIEALVELQKIIENNLSTDEINTLSDTIKKIASSYLHFYEGFTCASVENIIYECRELKAKKGLRLVIIDDLFENKQLNILQTLNMLKDIAMELKIPILISSQLKINIENRKNHRPKLKDIPNNELIEVVVNNIILLYRDAYYNPFTNKGNIAEIIVAKNKNGSTGIVELLWDDKYNKFKNI